MFNENQDPALEPVPGQASDIRPKPMTEAPGYSAPEQPRASMPSAPAYPQVSAYEDSDGPFVMNGQTPRQHRSKKGLAIALGCLLLALLAAGGWWFLKHLPRKDPLASLKQAAENTMRSYMDYTKDLPNLHKYQENILAVLQADGFHLDLAFSTDLDDSSLQLSMDRNGKSNQSRLNAILNSNGQTIPIDLYLDPDQIQLASSYMLTEGETLALPVKDFGKKFNESPLGKLAGSTAKLPDDFSLSFLTDGTSDKAMKNAFGSDWSDFMDSVSYRKATAEDGEDSFTADGETYVLVWDQALLDKMAGEAKTIESSLRTDPQLDKILPCARVILLQGLGQSFRSIRFRVADEMLIGAYLESQTKSSKGVLAVQIELVGADNPCSRMVISTYKQDAATGKMVLKSTGECTYTVADGKLIYEAIDTTPGADKQDASVKLVYTDADGRMAFQFDGDVTSPSVGSDIPGAEIMNSIFEGFDLRFRPDGDAARVEFELNMGAVTSLDPTLPFRGTAKITVALSPKNDAVEPLSQRPTQVLELSAGNLSSLITRIYRQIGIGSLPGSYN